MDTLLLSSSSSVIISNKKIQICTKTSRKGNNVLKLKRYKIKAISDFNNSVSAVAADSIGAQVTWQIVVGSIAGVAPFVVAGIEFSKRIVAQRRCDVCKGSGIVMRDKEFFRCPECGGFLPWQSWKRFFTG